MAGNSRIALLRLGAFALATAYILLVLFGPLQALGHDWYPRSCCSGYDCAPIASERVKAYGAGYEIDGRHWISREKAMQSPDGRYHVCMPTKERVRCFFAPPEGS